MMATDTFGRVVDLPTCFEKRKQRAPFTCLQNVKTMKIAAFAVVAAITVANVAAADQPALRSLLLPPRQILLRARLLTEIRRNSGVALAVAAVEAGAEAGVAGDG
ncbi:hypothetical protein L914_04286, partial [Phytophthora nicotianae]